MKSLLKMPTCYAHFMRILPFNILMKANKKY